MGWWHIKAERSSRSDALGRPDMRLLEERCGEQAPALLICLNAGAVWNGRFAGIDSDRIEMELAAPCPTDDSLRKQAQCMVAFHAGGRSIVFTTHVAVQPGAGGRSPRRVTLYLPNRVVNAEARRAFRLPVAAESELRACYVDEAGHAALSQVSDISLTGVGLRFPASDLPDAVPGASCTVLLRLGRLEVDVRGEVRQSRGAALGIYFVDVSQGDRLAPPKTLSKIVSRLERDWRMAQAS